jgi:hypothetical protein
MTTGVRDTGTDECRTIEDIRQVTAAGWRGSYPMQT